MMDTISFLHSGDIGDIVSSVPTVRRLCEIRNARAKFYLDASGGLDDPFVHLQARRLKFNGKSAEFLRPLLEIQPFVDSVEIVDGTAGLNPDYDLNAFRKAFVDPRSASFGRNLMYLHQMAFGLPLGWDGPFLEVPGDGRRHDLIVCRSARYQSAHLWIQARMGMIRQFGEFIGTDFEWDLWRECFCEMPKSRIRVGSALDAANALRTAENLIVNGTAFYWIGLGVGVPRIFHEVGAGIGTTVFQKVPEGFASTGKAPPNVEYVIGGLRQMVAE